MEDGKSQAFLRVLYTVNNNPQYVLAKSSSQVPVIMCSETTTHFATGGPSYARALLKTCLMVVCDSSPELLQDHSRDFSLYVLDPLEAPPLPTNLAPTPHGANSPRGVAIALGLMSWALESNDSMNVLVTGTIIPNASPALEIIFALRETKRMPRSMLYPYSSLSPISVPGQPQTQCLLHPSQPPGTSWSSTPYLQRDHQEQRTLTRSADFPELYIGPPRRAPGRPEGSTSSKSKAKAKTSTSSLPASSSRPVETPSTLEIGRKLKQESNPRASRATPTYPPFTFGPLTRYMGMGSEGADPTGGFPFYEQSYSHDQTRLHTQPQTRSYSHSEHNPLLGLLSAISPTSSGNTAMNATSEQQAILLSALQGLLATNPHLLQLATTNMVPPTSSGQRAVKNKLVQEAYDEHDDADSDIVILDSSNVDTTAFRKPNRKQLTAKHNDASPPPAAQSTDSSPLPASTPSGHEETSGSSQQSTSTVIPEVKTPTSRTERGNVTPSHALDIPATPILSRMRKRKLDEYIQGQARLSPPTSPPSPSMARTSSSGKTLTARQRILSSPTCGLKGASSPPTRLPSMLSTMRRMAISGSRLRVNSSGSSICGHPTSLTTSKGGGQPATLICGTSESGADRPEMKTASLNAGSNMTSLKRRLNMNLNDFMEEREARKKIKARKRPSSGYRPEVSTNPSEAGPSCAPRVVATPRNVQSSPRPLFRSDQSASSLPTSACPSALVSSISSPAMSASASIVLSASTATVAPTNNPLKNFVMPAWARTSTATLPRLSEEALARQRAEREVKRAQVSLKRREAAKAKRKRLRGAERPSKEPSDEGDETVPNDPEPRSSPLLSIVAPSIPLAPPPLPSLPVFASDAVEPIPSSPTQSHQQLGPSFSIPSTPPRKPVSLASSTHHSPPKSGSFSLFTPSGQDQATLFTPNTPSATRSITSVTFTSHSPTVLHSSGLRKSPWKVPRTPKRNSTSHQTPRSLRGGINGPFSSPSLAIRSPQIQMGIGTRAFLLPPPSPCTLRTPYHQNRHSNAPGSATPVTPESIRVTSQESPSGKRKKCSKGNVLSYHPDNTSIPLAQHSPDRPAIHDDQGTGEPRGIPPSPLPPSSPLPASPFSSPTKYCDSDFDMPNANHLVVPDSDILLPSANNSEGLQGMADATCLSDDACTASWFTDSEANAWLSETEAWLTDTEGAWLSDSDAVLGEISLPPSSTSNWLSDIADIDTDDEGMVMGAGDGGFDTAAFEKVFTALVEREGRAIDGKDEGGGNKRTTGAHDMKVIESELWESMRPLLEGNVSGGAGAAIGDVGEARVAQDTQ